MKKITIVVISKLNTIYDLVNKALDSTISAEEFSLILNEKEKYTILKNNIRIKLRETIDSKVDAKTLKKTFEEVITGKLKKT